MIKTLDEIAKFINGQLIGDKNIFVSQISPIKKAKEGDITFIFDKRELKKNQANQIDATCVVLPEDIETIFCPKIIVENPKLAFARLLELFNPTTLPPPGIHPTAIISKDAKIGKDVSIGAYVVIGDEVEIGDGVVIYPLTNIGHKVMVGNESILHSNVTIYDKVKIGKRVIIHSQTVIGSDGFGYIKTGSVHYKIPQKGEVVIEDDVEIGAGVTIDRATLGATVIGQGTKIDNLVHIGHNVKIGKNCIIVAQVGISGSVTIEDNVTIAGQAGVSDHVTIKENTIVAAQTGVMKDIGPNLIVSGLPARPHQEEMKIKALIQKLPLLAEKIKVLEKKAAELENR
ncbi:MAG: UDP-3-O-(3-hydroxymyristoyl)glucosamine N-acyltransferase [bacterium]|nr:UDP-3-O-(3-hydroxymyristoyl)glucosamine N-acyltransferase [bacterium]